MEIEETDADDAAYGEISYDVRVVACRERVRENRAQRRGRKQRAWARAFPLVDRCHGATDRGTDGS